MANRLLTATEILDELVRLDDEPGAKAGYRIEDHTIVRLIDCKSVQYTTADRTMTIDNFSACILLPLIVAPRKGQVETAQAYRVPRPEDVRGGTHGDYTHMSSTIQKIKDVMGSGEAWSQCGAGQREALEMIATKIGRIVCGDPNHIDHWDDIIGYATLAKNRIGIKHA